MKPIRWGVLSTANIARLVIQANRGSEVTRFTAVASRDAARAQRFAAEQGLEASFGSYEALLASDLVDAVYVALPVSMHTQWTLRALEAGKHVLCEKPFATSPTDAARCFDAAEAAGRVVVEGFMWRHHPQTILARRLVAEGAIGRLATIRAALSVDVPPGDIRRSPALAGGALYDLGCYCVSAARLFGGHPTRVWAEPVLDGAAGPNGGVDLRLAATMGLPDQVLALFDVGLDLTRRDELELVGTGGRLTVPDPWLCPGRRRRAGDRRAHRAPAGRPGGRLGADRRGGRRLPDRVRRRLGGHGRRRPDQLRAGRCRRPGRRARGDRPVGGHRLPGGAAPIGSRAGFVVGARPRTPGRSVGRRLGAATRCGRSGPRPGRAGPGRWPPRSPPGAAPGRASRPR
jgi:xylose dehydrogenase (NAD/NADP)